MHFTVQSGKAAGKLSKIVGNLKKRLRHAMNFREMQMLRPGYGATQAPRPVRWRGTRSFVRPRWLVTGVDDD
jgi:hypothetical protein